MRARRVSGWAELGPMVHTIPESLGLAALLYMSRAARNSRPVPCRRATSWESSTGLPTGLVRMSVVMLVGLLLELGVQGRVAPPEVLQLHLQVLVLGGGHR